LAFKKWCAIQGSNSVHSVDNQERAKQDSQGASQNLSALDPDLQTVIAAWDKLPPALRCAVLAIVSSHREHVFLQERLLVRVCGASDCVFTPRGQRAIVRNWTDELLALLSLT
jgi:uncharacterized protein YfaP (DUF2135 family)